MLGPREQLRALHGELPQLAAELQTLDQLLELSDVNPPLNTIRSITERVLHELCLQKGVSWGQGKPMLERMIGPLAAGAHLPDDVWLHVQTLQRYGNPASHAKSP